MLSFDWQTCAALSERAQTHTGVLGPTPQGCVAA